MGGENTVRFVPSSVWVRIGIFIGAAGLTVILFQAWVMAVKDMRKFKIKK